MVKSTTLFLLGIVFNCFYLRGQIVFDRVYNSMLDYYDGADAIIQTFDNGYIAIGTNFFGSSATLFVLKTKNNGDTLWTKIYDFSTDGADDGEAIIQLKDSSYIICGRTRDSLEQATDTYLLKLNASGEIIWFQQIEGGFNDRAYDLKQTTDGGFIIVGYNYDSTFSTSKISLIKTDSNGNKLWQQLYGVDTVYSFSNSVFITNDGGFIVGGETEDPSCNWCYKIYLIKTDSAGNLQWEKQYGHSLGQRWGYAVPTQDGGYIISGRKKYLDTLYYGYVIKTDDTGKVVWEKEYGENKYFKGFKRIIQLHDGTYLAAGDNQNFDSVTARNSNAWLVKLDSAGNQLWSKTYTHYGGDTTEDYLTDVSISNDGGFVFCGYVINDNIPTNNDGWLVKTDCGGNADKWDSVACPIGGVGISEEKIITDKTEVKIFPNPFSNSTILRITNWSELRIKNIELKLVDVLDREVLNEKINSEETKIERENLPSGIYFYQLRNGKEILGNGKLVISD